MKEKFFKYIKLFVLLFVLIPVLVFSVGCGTTYLSAYEIAVENGFEGSQTDWLDSLKGKSAYEIAVENGFEGSQTDWLDSLNGKDGKDGTNGINGKDALQEDSYDLYLNAKNENYEGSYLDFIRDNLTISNDNSAAVANKCVSSVIAVDALSSQNFVQQSGSGVIYAFDSSNNAYIVTNYHILINSNNYKVYPNFRISLFGQSDYIEACYVGGSSELDIAVLFVESNEILSSSNATAITIDTADVLLGETCYAVGNSRNEGIAVTRGIISVDSELRFMTVAGTRLLHRLIRHDASISHGNSGGGLFDENGNFIGLTNGGIYTDSYSTDNSLYFAIPASIVYGTAESIINDWNGQNSVIYKKYLNSVEKTSTTWVYTTEIGVTFEKSSSYWVYNSETGIIDLYDTTTIKELSQYWLDLGFKTESQIVSATLQNADGLTIITKTISRTHHFEDLLIRAKAGDTLLITISKNNVEQTKSIVLD